VTPSRIPTRAEKKGAVVAIIDYTDVEVSLGRPIDSAAEQAQVMQWIGDVELLVRSRLGDLAALDQDVLAYVAREAVLARLRNPEGYQSETIDDYTYRHGTETRRVTILDEWWDLLQPRRRARGRAYSVLPS
jgi:hypothetical protein